MTHFFKAEFSYQAFKLVTLIFSRCVGHLQNGLYIVFHGQFAEHAWFLSKIADAILRPLIDRIFCDVKVVQVDLSLVRSDQPYGHVESSRLAGSVRSEQAYNLSLRHVDRHMVCNCSLAILLHKIVCAKHHLVRCAYRYRRLYIGILFHLVGMLAWRDRFNGLQ